jgi:hypothetical protein
VKGREAWITGAKADSREVWRKQNRELAAKRTAALEREKRDRLAGQAGPQKAPDKK